MTRTSSPHVRNVVFRTDAGPSIGVGHLMRCTALAQALIAEGWRVRFVCATGASIARVLADANGFDLRTIDASTGDASDLASTCAMARDWNASWVVVDGYRFGAAFERGLREHGLHVLAIDDFAETGAHAADLLLDQNLDANANVYASSVGTQLLLGTEYALLRREFWSDASSAAGQAPRDTGTRLLLTMGGADPDNVSAHVLRALLAARAWPGLEICVVVGASNPHGALIDGIAQTSTRRITALRNVTDMARVIANTDLAISAAGSTTWELCRFGVPSLLFVLAPNQRRIAEAMQARGAACSLGTWHAGSEPALVEQLNGLLGSTALRARMSTLAHGLVDGGGAARVARAMASFAAPP